MTRVDLESLPEEVRAFVNGLPSDANGIELALQGKVIWKLVRPGELSDADKQVLLAHGRDFVRDVRERVKGRPAAEIKRQVTQAVDEVRRRTRQ
jgi:hypothetical protein